MSDLSEPSRQRLEDDRRVIAAALALCAFLWALKGYLFLWYRFARGIDALGDAPLGSIFVLGGADLVLCAVLAGIYREIWTLSAYAPAGVGATVRRTTLFALHTAVVVFSVISFEVNRIYSWPLDITHLRTADDPRIIRASIGAYLGAEPILLILLGLICYRGLAPAIERRLTAAAALLGTRLRLWGALAVATLVLGVTWNISLAGHDTYGVKQDAVLYFIKHYTPAATRMDASRMILALGHRFPQNSEQRISQVESLALGSAELRRDFPLSRDIPTPLNILVIQLESTSAKYIDPVTTPNVCRLAQTGVSFRNHFTVCTRSDRATYALYYSDYLTELGTTPRMLYQRPMPQPALPQVLHDAGYDTALFHSSFLSYMDFKYLFENKGFDTIAEASDTWDGHSELPWSWGVREEETVDGLVRWIDQRQGRPFFALYGTMFPHHPYLCPTDSKPFPETSWLNRYRNSLHYADSAVGRLIDALKERKLLEHTLIAVVGDHGESVAAYPCGHGMRVSGEELRTPFILSNPRLFPRAVVSDTATNHLDMAPTLARLAGASIPPAWLGRDLTAEQIPARMLYVTLPQRYDQAIIDNGIFFVRSSHPDRSALFELSGTDEPTPLPDHDRRAALLGSYKDRTEMLAEWIVWRHGKRALANDPTPPPPQRGINLLAQDHTHPAAQTATP